VGLWNKHCIWWFCDYKIKILMCLWNLLPFLIISARGSRQAQVARGGGCGSQRRTRGSADNAAVGPMNRAAAGHRSSSWSRHRRRVRPGFDLETATVAMWHEGFSIRGPWFDWADRLFGTEERGHVARPAECKSKVQLDWELPIYNKLQFYTCMYTHVLTPLYHPTERRV
jgi:hypothetical protein